MSLPGKSAVANPAGKSAVAQRMEEMAAQREERRRSMEAYKEQRALDAVAAEEFGGIDSLEFLKKIEEWRKKRGLGGSPIQFDNPHIWSAEHCTSAIRVCVRKRPMLQVEHDRLDFDVVSTEQDHYTVTVHEPKVRVDLSKAVENVQFTFDACFHETDGNETVYAAALAPLVPHVFGGGNATIFAFGQTGSGKTCTMAGHGHAGAKDGNASGLYALAANDVMRMAAERELSAGISFFEVYRGMVLDLLGGCARVETMEDATGHVALVGLREVKVESADGLLHILHQAERIRATGATSANEQSSRSHAILTITLREPIPGVWPVVGRLSLVDLAGSERARDSAENDEQTRMEGAEINKSLLALKECIRGLDAGKDHIPFRGSKLTQVLKESFVGNSRTVMIATVSPGSSAAEDTVNTLRYAQRVREFSSKRSPTKAQSSKRGGSSHANGTMQTGARQTSPPPSRRAPAPSTSVAPATAAGKRGNALQGTPPRAVSPLPSGRGTAAQPSGSAAAGSAAAGSARRSTPWSQQRPTTPRRRASPSQQAAGDVSDAVALAQPSPVVPQHSPGAASSSAAPAISTAVGPAPVAPSPPERAFAEPLLAPQRQALMEAAVAVVELQDMLTPSPEHPHGAGMLSAPECAQLDSILNTIQTIYEARGDSGHAATGMEQLHTLMRELTSADTLHDKGYSTAEEYARAMSCVIDAKMAMYACIRTTLEQLDAASSTREATAGVASSSNDGGTQWAWPWAWQA